MDIRQAIRATLSQSDAIVGSYLGGLSDADLLVRALPGTNHIAWQLGHLINSERYLVNAAVPGSIEPLPEGFDQRHKTPTAQSDDPAAFFTKDEYLALAAQVRAGTLRVTDQLEAERFDQPTVERVPPMVNTVGETLLFISAHWLMHAGQWALVRRKLGHAPLY